MRLFTQRPAYTNVLLRGGLGNQMFQYAAGLSVALRTGSRLRLDLTVLDRDRKRQFRLDQFNIDAELFHGNDAPPLQFSDPQTLAAEARARFDAQVVIQRDETFGDELSDTAANSLLVGYWQSDRYFNSVSDAVRAHFKLRRPSAAYTELRRRIGAEECAAVHIRRGDYAEDTSVQRVIGLLDASYYREAANELVARTGVTKFRVFSDDPEWCRTRVELPGDVEITSGYLADAEELHLISACDHAIVSNSSFSWWGAWLGTKAKSVVIAPSRWLRSVDARAGSRIPARWTTLPAEFVPANVE
ncbi:MAG: alpha-1,2-fucosyltransferase [Solirubrobacterales bacterium]